MTSDKRENKDPAEIRPDRKREREREREGKGNRKLALPFPGQIKASKATVFELVVFVLLVQKNMLLTQRGENLSV